MFIGITDVTFVYAEKAGFGPQAREAALKAAKAEIAELLETALSRAALIAQNTASVSLFYCDESYVWPK